MLPIFIGVDKRQPLAATVLQSSIYRHASQPVAITWLVQDQLPVKRRGLTDFTFTRYLVPWLMGYEGVGLFLDADMVVRGDIAELFAHAMPDKLLPRDCLPSVWVVKGVERFEWPSVMLFNCEKCTKLTPEFIEHGVPQNFEWGSVGDLPRDWNHCVGYDAPGDSAKLLHYTMGLPVFAEVEHLGHADEWKEELRAACSTVSWQELMGGSIHAERLRGA